MNFTIKHGTIEAAQSSAERQPYQVFTEIGFTDGDGFRGVAAEPALAEFVATDRSGTFYFYDAMGRGALLAADIHGVGWRFSDPAIWYSARNRKIIWLLAFAVAALVFVAIAASVQFWPAWIAAAAFAAVAALHCRSALRLARIAAAAQRIRRSLAPTERPSPRQVTDTGRFDNAGRAANSYRLAV
ncbi:hypothetical protein [Devosia sp. LC5]|uniref:hypothetical protein n=1 Tax=Devosia sp. LC5 TaxID=1502724 RepID=UPI001268D61C|nr:hypothetical protein [Devosia sp. LC5]